MRTGEKVAVTAIAVLAIWAASAVAFTAGPPSAIPTELSFGKVTVKDISSPQSVVVTVPCPGLGGTSKTECVPPSTSYPIAAKATGDFKVNSANCPPALVADNPAVPVSCVIDVSFKPTKKGKRTGLLSTGTSAGSPQVFLQGKGVKQKKSKKKKKKK